jgi:2-polyprenyl-6-hydroxyphenyl methylase / 3-demethylubiquinone-9 3-methyltransferase
MNAQLPPETSRTANVDDAEVARFGRIAAEWWDLRGKFAPLHRIGPVRIGFVRDMAVAHFGLPDKGMRPLTGLKVLDIGCGGGLVAEPLARLGATVTAIDPAPENIGAARRHAEPQGLTIDYRACLAEELVANGETFDCVVCLEVIEHVPDPAAFVAMVAKTVRPGGLLVMSTINRTLKAYALAIVGAEYVLGWLPRGTHQWDRFVTIDEMRGHLRSGGLVDPSFAGIAYNPLTDVWSRGRDLDVNYLVAAAKPVASAAV